MKEARFFYFPKAATETELPMEEALHALKVLRLKSGDVMFLMDGSGCFYKARVTIAASKRCLYEIEEAMPQTKDWGGYLHVAVAPTKMIDRMEWFVEKATEIGVDEFSFLNCRFSERKVMRMDRVEKIVVSAMKQSRKAWKPIVNQMIPFCDFISQPREGQKYIAHCYDEIEKTDFFDVLRQSTNNDENITVLIGPEGDFSIDEVKMAMQYGYVSVSLGKARLRTETAALSATMMMQLAYRFL